MNRESRRAAAREQAKRLEPPLCPNCSKPVDRVSAHMFFEFDVIAVSCTKCRLYGIKGSTEPWLSLPTTVMDDDEAAEWYRKYRDMAARLATGKAATG